MLDYLEEIGDDFDALFFTPAEKDRVYVQSNNYIDKGLPLESSTIGPKWHVVLFRSDGENVKDLDHFEGILSDPREYISGLIPSGWFGVVAKKTTTSEPFIKKVLADFKELM